MFNSPLVLALLILPVAGMDSWGERRLVLHSTSQIYTMQSTNKREGHRSAQFWPGTTALKEIWHHQKQKDNLILRLPFGRLVCKIALETETNLRFQANVFTALHEASEVGLLAVRRIKTGALCMGKDSSSYVRICHWSGLFTWVIVRLYQKLCTNSVALSNTCVLLTCEKVILKVTHFVFSGFLHCTDQTFGVFFMVDWWSFAPPQRSLHAVRSNYQPLALIFFYPSIGHLSDVLLLTLPPSLPSPGPPYP